MSGQQNEDKDPKAEVNKEASEKMSKNDDMQNELFRKSQNEVTQSSEGNHDQEPSKATNDSLSEEEINKRKLKSEQDADFGNEQLQ